MSSPSHQPAASSREPSGADHSELVGRLMFALFIVLMVALLLGSVVLWHYARLWAAERALAEEITKLRAAGEPVYLEEFAAEVSPEAARNGQTLMQVIRRWGELWQDPSIDRKGVASLDTPEVHPDYALDEEAVAATMRRLEPLAAEAIERMKRDVQLPFDYANPRPFSAELPTSDVFHLRYYYGARLRQAIAHGDRHGALAALHDNFYFAQGFRNEPFVIGKLVHLSYAGQALEELEGFLAIFDCDDDELAPLDALLVEVDRTLRLKDAARSERAFQVSALRSAERVGSGWMSGEPNQWRFPERLRPEILQAQTLALRGWQGVPESIDDLPAPRPLNAPPDPPYDPFSPSRGENWLLDELGNDSIDILRVAGLRMRQRLLGARIAIEILRQRKENPDLTPETLSLDRLGVPDPLVSRVSGRPVTVRWDDAEIFVGIDTPDADNSEFRVRLQLPQSRPSHSP